MNARQVIVRSLPWIIVFGVLVVLLWPDSGIHPRDARQEVCLSNIRSLGLALLMYADDNQGTLPAAAVWAGDATLPYRHTDETLRCPADKAAYSYAMNKNLSERKLEDLLQHEEVPVLFDSTQGKRNAHDSGQSWPVPPRHPDGNSVAFAYGNVRCVRTKPDFRVRWRKGEPRAEGGLP